MKELKYVESGYSGTDWEDEYKRKLVSADEAVKLVNSGDRVVFPTCAFPRILGPALAARKSDHPRRVSLGRGFGAVLSRGPERQCFLPDHMAYPRSCPKSTGRNRCPTDSLFAPDVGPDEETL